MTSESPRESTLGNGSSVLITGASRGIGRAIAEKASRVYDTVILVARSADELSEAASSFGQLGASAHSISADLAQPNQIELIARIVEERFGRLDALIHAAGVYQTGLLEDDRERGLMAVNYYAPAHLTLRLKDLLKTSKGQVIFVNSTQGLNAGVNTGAYAASKFALRAFADSLRAELNVHGVRISSLFLGATATAMQEGVYAELGKPYRPERLLQPADVAEMVVGILRLPRTAEVVDLTLRPCQPPSPPH